MKEEERKELEKALRDIKHLAIRCTTDASGHLKLSEGDRALMAKYAEAVIQILSTALATARSFRKKKRKKK